MKFFTIVVLSLVLFGCNSTEKSSDVTDEKETSTEKLTTWEDYWKVFQAATAEMDKEKIVKLTYFNENLTEKHFHDLFESYFSAEMQTLITETNAVDVPISDDPISDFQEERELMLYESAEVDGELYESAMFLYFSKVEDEYKMMMWLAAG